MSPQLPKMRQWLDRALPLRPPEPPPGRFLRVAGKAVHVVTDGPQDAPVVVLEAGLGGSWLGWDPVVELLADRCRLVRADRPGLGRSEPAPVPPTLAGRARWASAVLDALRVRDPVVLVGHSLGGLYAEAFARLFPQRTAAAVLVEAASEGEVGPPQPLPAARIRTARAVGETLRRAGLSQLVAPGLRRLGVRTQSQLGRDPVDAGSAYRSAYGTGHVLTEALVERALFRDLVAELEALRGGFAFPAVPLRVIAGPGVEVARHRALAAMSPLGRYDEVPGTRHLVPVDRPDAIAGSVSEVLDALAAPASPVASPCRTDRVRTTPRK
ncbi:alpha/beta hydrolase [Streptomyces sp. RB6PN25]|uniref:Alpha/beta hydrolase n=1 Tax=Streptomyces humicola TaxID=2953240 RepID=A0ABT1Q4A7_9ACTN|nr:alpha/beta hydrolase [Streptomyces humicola]MCQ4084754.1 alpha/beta hydrolase [Streptomyces humicola]